MHDLLEWLQEFRENLVDERNSSEPRRNRELGYRDTSSSFHELPMESRAQVEPGSGKHDVHRHFPKDPICDICLKTKITRAFCRRRAGTVVPRAEIFGNLITAHHKILSEESESRNNHRFVVVVPDLATEWLQSYPCKAKTSQETQKSLTKFLAPTRKPKVIYTGKQLMAICCHRRGGVNSTPHTSLFLMHWARANCGTSHCMAQECVGARHVIYMVINVVRLSVPWLSVPHLVLFRVFLLSLLLLHEPWAEPLPPCGRHRGNKPLALRQLRSLAPWPKTPPLTSYEPNTPDDFHYLETTEIFFQVQSSDTVPSYLFDTELDDETIGRALSSPLFIQEREEPADRNKLITLLKKVCCQLSPCLCKNGETRAWT